MAVVSSSSSTVTSTTTHVLHRLLRPPQPPPLFFSILRPLSCSVTTNLTTKSVLSKHQKITATTLFSFLHSPPNTSPVRHFSHSLPTSLNAINPSLSLEQEQEDTPSLYLNNELEEEEEDDDDEEYDTDSGTETESLELDDNAVLADVPREGLKRNGFKVPNLTVKEKKELASYANSLGKKLKSQLVGKSGVTDNVATSFIETLEANELLKIKIHRTCPGELEDVVQRLQEATGSVVVGQIGRTVIIYRPSLSKMEAEEKRRQARRIYVRKEPKLKPISLRRAQVPRLSGRGRRGSSRG
ncbi:uncharacterized protein LOC8284352 isoform X2 [Ricinus communis]|uniref:uncharacterized protein LOC8284352 isoform X2 n=1 Tax=Ricinus communis TaxID=3988 RepID=UPI00201AEC7C|nr:uncharacterized protein LOC8284352 isoform X2 [Ricinus communis]